MTFTWRRGDRDRTREARARRLDVLELLPDRWALGPTFYYPGIGRWSYTARGPHPGRGKYPERIAGTGEDDLAAMIDLAQPTTWPVVSVMVG